MIKRELRLAVVIYGGASLAVYMHGVTKELLKLVRASKVFHELGRDRALNAKYETARTIASTTRKPSISTC